MVRNEFFLPVLNSAGLLMMAEYIVINGAFLLFIIINNFSLEYLIFKACSFINTLGIVNNKLSMEMFGILLLLILYYVIKKK